jgi:hypothetical protein
MWHDLWSRRRRIVAAAMVALLHCGIAYEFLTSKATQVTTHSASLAVTLYATLLPKSNSSSRSRYSVWHQAGPYAEPPLIQRIKVEPITLLPNLAYPRHPRFDWDHVLEGEVGEMESRLARGASQHRFGFPPVATPHASSYTPAWDGWDFAATHPIVQLPQGGWEIPLNDHCAIDITPIPIAGCFLGDEGTAKGDLFKNLRKERGERSDSLP